MKKLTNFRIGRNGGKTNYWTGTQCRDFEREFAEYMGVKYAIAVMNGTVALEAALYALEIGPGDEVITSCRTFIASASCIVMRGAKPILADVDLDSQNITAETILPCITAKTKAIIVVHLAGWPADMKNILKLAKKYDLKVIEDCAQAHGAKIDNQYVGTWGDIATFSFCQDKIITTGGEGGMITTQEEKLWQKLWSFKDHGKNYSKVYQSSHPPGFRWLHDSFGTNLRMTEMQAAIGRIQLKKLGEWLKIRNQFATIFNTKLPTSEGLRITLPPSQYQHAYYKYYIFIQAEKLNAGWNRNIIMDNLQRRGVTCFVGSCHDIYYERAFSSLDKDQQILVQQIAASIRPNARLLGETSLMFLVDPSYTADEIHQTADLILEIMSVATQQLAKPIKISSNS